MTVRRSLGIVAVLFCGVMLAVGFGPLSFWRGYTGIDLWLSRLGQAIVASCAVLAARGLPRPRGRISRIGGLHVTTAVLFVLIADSLIKGLIGRGSGVAVDVEALTSVDKLSSIVRAPVTEELIFRGGMFVILCAGLARLSGRKWMAAFVSGALFGLAHVPDGGWEVLAPTMLGGMSLAAAFELSGTVWAPILAHAIGNAESVYQIPEITSAAVALWLLSAFVYGYHFRNEDRRVLFRNLAHPATERAS